MKQGNTISVLEDYIRMKTCFFLIVWNNSKGIYMANIFIITICILIYEGNIIKRVVNG